MKKARIFFALTAFIIAIVGVVATKANTRIQPYYYYDLINHVCVPVDQITDCAPNQVEQCYYLNDANYPMFEKKIVNDCVEPLERP